MNQKVDEKPVEKTPKELRQEQRDSIEVVKSDHDITTEDEPEDKKEKEDDENKDDKGDEGKETKEEKDDKETKETKDEDDEEIDDENDPEKLKKTIAKLQRRIGTKTNTEKTLKDQLADAQAKLKAIEEAQADGTKVLTEEDVKTEAQKIAQQQRAQEKLDNAFEKLEKSAKEIDKNFPEKVTELGQDYGLIPIPMIEILDDLERGGAVLNYLCDNPEEYEEIRKLTPGKMATKLNAINEKVKPKKAVKEISKVPAPNQPVKPQATPNDTVVTGKESMEDFVRKRAAMREKKRQARGY